ncbi:MAG: 4,5-DOPA dioxygenase extradiol [Parabacteroides sp.]|jgi:4,5-DOPA dioxygenase extradiol|nr:4,5-DOPA dioxygenase extradiol [Parabacteroides sp.]
MNFDSFHSATNALKSTAPMPVLFVGHGSPMNAIEINEFSDKWRVLGKELPRPSAVLCISAHWETRGTQVTAMQFPETIHDFGGFPQALFDVSYPANGNPELAKQIRQEMTGANIGLNVDWGLDHGCWSILTHLYPDATVPVLQLSLDYTIGAQNHFNLAKQLAFLRSKGVLIIGSGNMIHNLRQLRFSPTLGLNEVFGYDWALEMTDLLKQKIMDEDYNALINYEKLSLAARLAIPTTDHYFPLLYALALRTKDDNVSFFNDKILAGSIGMTSVLIDSHA